MKRLIIITIVLLSLVANPVSARPYNPKRSPATSTTGNAAQQTAFWRCVNAYAARTHRKMEAIKGDEARQVIRYCRKQAAQGGK